MGIEKMKSVWPEWQIVCELGRGSFGTVYKAVREEQGVTSYAAVKIISIPRQEGEVKSLRGDGLDESATRSYFSDIVSGTVNEIKMLVSMKGTSNIVSVEDYKVLEDDVRIGWDIFIRMELLTPFLDYIADKQLDEKEVIRLGIDIASALDLCAKCNIIHRDVKPENIFVSPFGDFKIGDFGSAREIERSPGSLSVWGTHNYMAPEVMSKHYDATADIYSLGLVLYKLLNNNRLPFLDPNVQMINPADYHAALEQRFGGEPLPDPVKASPDMAQLIRIACAFEPTKRFPTAAALKQALLAVLDIVESTALHAEAQKPSLLGIDGMYRDGVFPLDEDEALIIGRDAQFAHIVITENAEKISKKHVTISYDSSAELYVVVDNSSNGTYFSNGMRLTPETPVKLLRGTVIFLSKHDNSFKLR